jgi:hypothetical protein
VGVTRLELSIDELVLVGIAPADRHRLADEIERELTRIAVDVHPSWSDRMARTPRHRAVRPVGRGGSVARQVADRISTTLSTGRSS